MRYLILLLSLLLCTACTALPAEERSFTVALCVEKAEEWRVHGRIPTYQSGGGYQSVTGTGASLSAALNDMDAAAPMHINFSQLRLLVLDEGLASAGELKEVLGELAERPDMRLACAVALCEAPGNEVADALKPAAGSRLSKALELLLDARIEQGMILPATLADVLRMGERQTPVLIQLELKNKEITLAGGIALDADLRPALALQPEETALLSMLQGHSEMLRLNLPPGSADVRDVSARVRLAEDFRTAQVTVFLRTTDSSFTSDDLEKRLAQEFLSLLSRLSAQGCDVLGLGRRAILHAHDMAQWNVLDWPALYRNIRWSVSVQVSGPT